MNDEERVNEKNRRTLLKNIGVGGAALARVPSVTSAEATGDHVDRVLENSKVRSIQEAVGGFEVQEVDVNVVEANGKKLTSTSIETNLGKLVYAESSSGKAEAKLDFADLSENPALRKRLPRDYRNVPSAADVMLFGGESSVTMGRTVTNDEEKKLKQAIPEPSDAFEIGHYTDHIDGYVVITENSKYHIETNGRAITPENVEKVATAQGGCWDWCGQCASWAASKGICYGSCALVATVAGAVLCVACVASTNMSLIWAGPACGECFNNCV